MAEDDTVATGMESVPPSTPMRGDPEPEDVPTNGDNGKADDGLDPFTSPREEFFDKRTWWMCDLSCVADDAPNQGATPLVARCMRVHGWDEDHTRRVLTAYKQFLTLKAEKQDWYAKDLTPCAEVEKMWKEHIVDMGNYWHDCQLLCGHVVCYNPDESVDENAKASHLKSTQMALKAKFGARFDAELWDSEGFKKKGIFVQTMKSTTKPL
mmetsp:Transcript_17586/g.47949  ORF Transcript_17586/g.47949 Transcript_17586/m.47949 type:complete len:210 (-) Transcript_17586:288-917(-)